MLLTTVTVISPYLKRSSQGHIVSFTIGIMEVADEVSKSYQKQFR